MTGAEGRHGFEELEHSAAFKELGIVAYLGDFRIVGRAHFGVATRASSRRASDYIRSFNETHLTLSDVQIFDRASRQLVDRAPFIILNMDKVDFLYAREDDPEEPGAAPAGASAAAPPEAAPPAGADSPEG